MKYFFKTLFVLVLPILFLGCGGGDTSPSGTTSSLSVETISSTLNSEKETMNLNLTLSSNYGNGIEANLTKMDISVDSCNIKKTIFTPTVLILNDETSSEEVNVQVEFIEPCTPTSYSISGKNILGLEGRSNEVAFNLPTQEISPEVNETVVVSTPIDTNGSEDNQNNVSNENNESNESSVDTINYGIQFSLEAEEVMRFNLEDKKSIQIGLIDKDSGSFISSQKIVALKVISKQENLLKVFDSNINTVPAGTVNYQKANNLTVYVQTYTRSGLADIDVEIEYINGNGNIEKITKTYSTMVQSGPPTAFSINTAGVSYNFETKWFENKFLISAVDRYNNVVNISPTIYVSAMTGFTKDSKGKEVLYGNFGEVEGKLNVDKESKTASFEANSTVFDNIDVNRDYLYLFGQIDDYEALGKWDIDSFESSHTDTLLILSEAFNGENHDKLGFALGHNYLIDPGSSESSEWQVKIDSTDGRYQLDEEGKAFVTLKFPPYIIGKRTALAVNFLGKTPETGKILRSGEVKFKTLSSFEGVIPPDSISVDKNTTKTVTVPFYINTGTGDKWSVQNSHVDCFTTVTGLTVVGFQENNLVSTVEEFKANGNSYNAYWRLTLKADEDKGGTFSFDECQVRTLPRF